MEVINKACGISLLKSSFGNLNIIDINNYITKLEEEVRNAMPDADTYTWSLMNIALRVSDRTWTGYHSWFIKDQIISGNLFPKDIIYRTERYLWPEVYDNRFFSNREKRSIINISEIEFDGLLSSFKDLTDRCCDKDETCQLTVIDNEVDKFFSDSFPATMKKICLNNNLFYFPTLTQDVIVPTTSPKRSPVCMTREKLYDTFSFKVDTPSNPQTGYLFNNDLVIQIREKYKKEIYMRQIALERIQRSVFS